MKKIMPVIMIMSFILIFPAVFITDNSAAEGEIEGIESNLTDDTNSQGKPAVYENFVVWNENVITDGKSNWEIFLYDLSMDTDGDTIPNYLENESTQGKPQPDPARIRITNNISLQLEPEIYGDKIVWEDKRHGNFDIFMYDLSVDTDSDGFPNYLDDDDDNDLTPDENDTDSDPAEIQITSSLAHQEKPSIYKNKIVWVDKRYGNEDIFIYDILTQKESIVIGHSETGDPLYRPKQNYPKLYGNHLVWQDDREFNWDIFLYDLSLDSDSDGTPNFLDEDRPSEDPAEIAITSSEDSEIKPVIYRDIITYIKLENIYVYDLKTNMEHQVTESSPSQKIGSTPCSIHGGKIVWTYDDGGSDVYLYDLFEDTDSDDVPNYMDSDTPTPDTALKRITNDSQPQIMLPFIYADKIVWQDSRNESKPADRDIYIYSLTENKAPKIEYGIPNFDSEIEEGKSISFIIEADDPEGEPLTYEWLFNGIKIPQNDTKVLEFFSDFGMAGTYEIKVIVSDSEYEIEYIWSLYISESGEEPIDIIWADPSHSPQIIEGDDIMFRVRARYRGSEEPNVTWIFPDDAISEITLTSSSNTLSDNEILSEASISSNLQLEGSYFVSNHEITVIIRGDGVNQSYFWRLSIIYFEDADFDGYSDSLENLRNSDPRDPSSVPADTDSDLIVDADDDDIDGDGYLGKYDADDTNSNRQVDEEPVNMVEISIILISIVLLVASVTSLSRASKR
jgi:beta propeller repeat protein